MEIGKIVEIEGVNYISEKEINYCEYCAFDKSEERCRYEEKISCIKDKNIMIRVSPTLIEQVKNLKNKIETLEKTIKYKDLEIEDLKYEVRRLIDGHPSKEGYKMMSRIMENS